MSAELAALEAEVARLRAAIVSHHSASKGHGLCWLNDVELWRAVGLGLGEDVLSTLPVRGEFLAQCARYHESRLKGTPYAEPEVKDTVK